MKKLALVLVVVSNCAYADVTNECKRNIEKKEDILNTKLCIEKKLRKIKEIFQDYNTYYGHVESELNEIIAGQEKCIENEFIYSEALKSDTLSDDAKKDLEESVLTCRKKQHERLIDFSDITKRFRDTTVRIDKLRKSDYEKGMKLFYETIKDIEQLQKKNESGNTK